MSINDDEKDFYSQELNENSGTINDLRSRYFRKGASPVNGGSPPLIKFLEISDVNSYNITNLDYDLYIIKPPEDGMVITLDESIPIGRNFKVHRTFENGGADVNLIIPYHEEPFEYDYPILYVQTLDLTKIAEDRYIIEFS